jgi:hypothetical protein
MPEIAPECAVRLAVPLSAWVTAITEAPDPSIFIARLPWPSSLCTPKSWPRQSLRSTSTNCICEDTPMPLLATLKPNVPLAIPPKVWASPMVRSSLPLRKFAATAVRPSVAVESLMLAAESRRSRLKSLNPSNAIGRASQLRSFLAKSRTPET